MAKAQPLLLEDLNTYAKIERYNLGFLFQSIGLLFVWGAMNFFLNYFVDAFDITIPWIRAILNGMFLIALVGSWLIWRRYKFYIRGRRVVVMTPYRMRVTVILPTSDITIRQGFLQRRLGYGTIIVKDGDDVSELSYVKDPYGIIKQAIDSRDDDFSWGGKDAPAPAQAPAAVAPAVAAPAASVTPISNDTLETPPAAAVPPTPPETPTAPQTPIPPVQ